MKLPFVRKRSLYSVLTVCAVVIAVARIVSSYPAISQTWDETDHLACGMQMLDRGTYDYEVLHPPVSRLFIAALPYADGARSHGDRSRWKEGNEILFAQGTYWRTLTLARLGVLPFFILAIVSLWVWTKKMFDERTACFAVVFFTLLPPVLAHAGVATTDMPLTGVFLAACVAFDWWLERPSLLWTLWLGILIGTGCATKFSFLTFFPIAAIVILSFKFGVKHRFPKLFRKRTLRAIASVAAISAITLWAWYGFSFGPVVLPTQVASLQFWMQQHHTPHALQGVIHWTMALSLPAPEFFRGLGWLGTLRSGFYLLGHPLMGKSSILFFPVALSVKTPVAFLILVLVSLLLVVRAKQWSAPSVIPLAIATLMLVLVLFSTIDLGTRHILPLYAMLAILASVAAVELIGLQKPYGAMLLGAFIVWTGVSSFRYGKDQIAYFNEFAGAHPEHYLLDSDLDWGQDLDKMADTVRVRHIDSSLAMYYFGSADPLEHGFPPYTMLVPDRVPNAQWVVISKSALYAEPGFWWLKSREPVAEAGNSMLLYRLN